MTILPVRTPEERAASLETANKVIQERVRIKKALTKGDLDLASLFDIGGRGVGDPIVGRMKVGQVLRALRRVGPIRSERALAAVKLNGDRRIDTISADKLQALVDYFA